MFAGKVCTLEQERQADRMVKAGFTFIYKSEMEQWVFGLHGLMVKVI